MKTKTIIMLSALWALFGHAAQGTKDVYVENVMSTHNGSSGCQIATDISLTSESVVETEVEICDLTTYNSTLFCARGSRTTDRSFVVTYDVAKGWAFTYGSTTTYSNVLAEPGRRYIVRATPDGLYVDGVRVIETTPASFSPPGKLALFAFYTAYTASTDAYTWNAGSRANANFWWFKVYGPDGNGGLALEHELMPCQCTNSFIGMYDEKTGIAWYNIGSRALGAAFTVPAPGGVGDVVALTNVLRRIYLAARVTSGSSYCNGRFDCRLTPGVYNLTGVYMETQSHLAAKALSTRIYGLGQGPADTVLVGEGSPGKRRVLAFGSNLDRAENIVSNLTVTGGYASQDNLYGGGILANGQTSVIDSIVSNNYASGTTSFGGGGIYGAKLVKNCLIAGNSVKLFYGGGLCTCTLVEDCVITNNSSMYYAGGVYNSKVLRCLIAGNRAKYDGGGQMAGVAIDCAFIDNVARYDGSGTRVGGGLYGAVATNCFFAGNSDNGFAYGSAASASTLIGCTVTDSVGRYSILDRCRLVRSRVADVGPSTGNGSFRVFSRYDGNVLYTNVNSIIENVAMSNDTDRVAATANVFVNCTIRNVKGNATYGPLGEGCVAVNTIISDCEPYDVTASTAPAMMNCLYRTASGEFAEGRLVDCVQGNPKFKSGDDLPHLSIGCSSPAFNAGREDGWILGLVGDTDFAGNPRRLFGRIDIGALECLSDKIPGLRLYVQ